MAETYLGTYQFEDQRVRAGAELLDDLVGKKGDQKLTAKDVRRAEQLWNQHERSLENGEPAKSPLNKLSDFEVGLVGLAVPALSSELRTKTPHHRRVFATAMPVDVIALPEVRSCAALVTEFFGRGPEDREINLTDIQKAKVALESGLAGLPPEAVERLEESGVFTLANIDHIDIFLRTEKTGLVRHDGVKIGGHAMPMTFRLPVEGVAHGEEPDPQAIQQAIDKLETTLGDRSNYDRIYFKGPIGDNGLYLALNSKGRIGYVNPGDRVQMKRFKAEDTGEVLRVIDIDNSLVGEAIIGFWGKMINNIIQAVRKHLLKGLDRRIEQATTETVEILEEKRDPGEVISDVKKMIFAGSGAASFGAAMFNLPVATGIITGSGIFLTLSNVYNYLRRTRDMRPIYQALGISVNRDEKIRRITP